MSREISNTEVLHTALVRIKVEIFDELPTGELARMVGKDEALLRVRGSTKSVCEARVKDLLGKLQKEYQ